MHLLLMQPIIPPAANPEDPSEHHGVAANCRAEIQNTVAWGAAERGPFE